MREDFAEILEALDIPKDKRGEKINAVAEKIGISRLLCKHPFDLSGGEQQKCAIAKMHFCLSPKYFCSTSLQRAWMPIQRKN